MNENSYNKWYLMTNKAISENIGQFVKHQRLEKNQTQQEVADAAGISRSTLSLLERGETVTVSTLIQVLRAINSLYVLNDFQIEHVISPIAMAKEEKAQRYRARKKNQPTQPDSEW